MCKYHGKFCWLFSSIPILCNVHIIFLAREKYRMEDKKVFANIVSLHAEVYYHMRLSNGNKVNILAEPLIHYLGDLMQISVEENIYFIMIQVNYFICISIKKNSIIIIWRFFLDTQIW